MLTRYITSAALLLVTATASVAATVQFDDRTTFEAAAAGLTTNDLNSFVSDVDLAGSAVVDVGDFTITGPASGIARIDAGGDGVTPVDGTAYIQGIGAAGSSIVFTFATSIFSFGVDLFGINNNNERTQVVIDGDIFSLPVVGGNVASFFGVTSDTPFNTVAFSLLLGEDAGLDNITYGGDAAVIPLPGGLPLLLAGLAGLGIAARRRKSA